MNIFIAQDESGDLGFDPTKQGASQHFCVTFVISKDKRKLEKIIKRVFADFSKQRIGHRSGVLHAYTESSRTKHLLIRRLKKTDAQVFVIKVDKTKVQLCDIPSLYNDLTILLVTKVFEETGADKIALIASRKDTRKAATEDFTGALDAAFHDSIDVVVKRPSEEKSLQVADCVSWGLFRKYEWDDDEFYREILPMLHEYDHKNDKTPVA